VTQVDFVIGGATRSATRVLHRILNAHPRIYMPEKSLKKNRRQASPMSYFDVSNQGKEEENGKTLYGEWEDVAEDCARYYPKAKIIFNLRNPVTRAYSQFCKAKRDGKETAETFEQAIKEEMEGIRRPETTGRCWIYKSQYQIHLDEWFSYFPKEQVHIVLMEEWIDDPATGLMSLEKFLGLEAGSLGRVYNAQNPEKPNSIAQRLTPFLEGLQKFTNSNSNQPLAETTKAELEDIYSVDKLYVTNVLGRDEIEAWQ
tara:strand:+ start:1417 stop:2187 length:771 start_codon:yes stop_codon:yes gene_type:complete